MYVVESCPVGGPWCCGAQVCVLGDRANLNPSLAAPKGFYPSSGKTVNLVVLGGWGAAATATVAAPNLHSPTGMVGRGGPLAIAAAPYSVAINW